MSKDTEAREITLGDIADALRPLKERGATRDSVRYVMDRIWWEEVDADDAGVSR